jgi:hypothetical protein
MVYYAFIIEFELRASHLLGRHSDHLNHSANPFWWWVFSG